MSCVADAAVRTLDPFPLDLAELGSAAFDKRRVAVHLNPVIHDRRNQASRPVVEQLVETPGFYRTEKAG